MKSILVPVDFSEASSGAVDYAVQWSQKYGYEEIILFKVHYESFMDYISTMGIGYSFMDKDASVTYRKSSKELLKKLKKSAQEKLGPAVQIRTATSDLPLTRGIMEILAGNPAIQMIVLGSDHTGVNADEPGFITANIIKIARISPIKILIVPQGYAYTPIQKVLVPCDLKHLTHLAKLAQYKAVLASQRIELTILDISDKDQQDQKQTINREQQIHAYLENLPLAIFHQYDKNTLQGVLSFVENHDTDLIVALPGTHSFLYYIANKSLSEGIYKNTRQAVLLLK